MAHATLVGKYSTGYWAQDQQSMGLPVSALGHQACRKVLKKAALYYLTYQTNLMFLISLKHHLKPVG